jgi:hypothetical protein
MIFVGMKNAGTEIEVSGDTYPFRFELSKLGLGYITSKKVWRGRTSLDALKRLSNLSSAMISSEAIQSLEDLKKSQRKREAYRKSRSNLSSSAGGDI